MNASSSLGTAGAEPALSSLADSNIPSLVVLKRGAAFAIMSEGSMSPIRGFKRALVVAPRSDGEANVATAAWPSAPTCLHLPAPQLDVVESRQGNCSRQLSESQSYHGPADKSEQRSWLVTEPDRCVAVGLQLTSEAILERLSLKFLKCTPQQLESSVRNKLEQWLCQAPAWLLQGCLRAGCLTLDVDDNAREPALEDLGTILACTPSEAFFDLSRLHAYRRNVVHIHNPTRGLLVRNGRVPASPQADDCTFPQLSGISLNVVQTGVPLELVLHGNWCVTMNVQVLVTMQGRYISNMHELVEPQQRNRQAIKVTLDTPTSPVLLVVEVCQASRVSSWLPILVVDDTMVEQEVLQLRREMDAKQFHMFLVNLGFVLDFFTFLQLKEEAPPSSLQNHPYSAPKRVQAVVQACFSILPFCCMHGCHGIVDKVWGGLEQLQMTSEHISKACAKKGPSLLQSSPTK